MLAGLVLVMSLSKLLFYLLCHHVNGGIEIAFDILGKEVRAGQRETNGTGELSLGRFGLILLESDSSIHGKAVEVSQFFDSADDMIFDGFGESEIMRRKDQIHGNRMERDEKKIQ